MGSRNSFGNRLGRGLGGLGDALMQYSMYQDQNRRRDEEIAAAKEQERLRWEMQARRDNEIFRRQQSAVEADRTYKQFMLDKNNPVVPAFVDVPNVMGGPAVPMKGLNPRNPTTALGGAYAQDVRQEDAIGISKALMMYDIQQKAAAEAAAAKRANELADAASSREFTSEENALNRKANAELATIRNAPKPGDGNQYLVPVDTTGDGVPDASWPAKLATQAGWRVPGFDVPNAIVGASKDYLENWMITKQTKNNGEVVRNKTQMAREFDSINGDGASNLVAQWYQVLIQRGYQNYYAALEEAKQRVERGEMPPKWSELGNALSSGMTPAPQDSTGTNLGDLNWGFSPVVR